MPDFSCEQAELLGADVAMGRASEADRVRWEAHLSRCAACRDRTDRLDAFSALLRSETVRHDDPRDRALLDRAMEAVAQTAEPRRPRSLAVILAAAAALLLAIGGATWLAIAGGGGEGPPRVADRAPRETAPRPPREIAPGPVPPPRSDPARFPPGTESPLALLPMASTPCPGVTVEPSEDARAWVLASRAPACKLALDRGELRVRVDATAGAGLSIDTPSTTVLDIGTTFLVRVDEHGGTTVTVLHGAVTVQSGPGIVRVDEERTLHWPVGAAPPVVEPAGVDELARLRAMEPEEPVAVRPGGTGRRPREGRAAPVAELHRLLARGRAAEARAQAEELSALPEHARLRAELLTVIAESYAVEGDYRRSLDTYRRVWTTSRGSSTAANAILSAADMAGDRLRDPRQAAQLYEQYLREYPTGPLREAATLGRCRSLRSAGQRADAQACARDYLERFPEGRLRSQAEAIAGTAAPR